MHISNIFKQNSTLFLLSLGFLGSATLHAAIMLAPMPTLWRQAEQESDDTIEVVVEAPEQEKPPIIAEKTPEIIKEPDVISKEIPVDVAPPAIALAPETSQNVGRDAPAADSFKPLTSNVGDTAIPTNIGKVIKDNSNGWGFGLDKKTTGFVRGGSPVGDPNGVTDGKKDGVVNGKKDGKGTEPVSTLNPPPPKTPLKLECISCPKPKYRGREGTPKVTYDITPDGKVANVRLRKSSGDAETDRETLEAMSKWQFNPKTIPEGGRTNVKVRVTFEESGSQFQRENEERRLAAERQRVTDKERQQREAERVKPTPPTVKAPEPIAPKAEPVYVAPAPPVYVPPTPIVAPAPVEPPPQPPVYVAPEPIAPAELPPPPES